MLVISYRVISYTNEFYLSLYAHLYEEIIFQKLNYIEK
jgi:hypothetical protein